MSLYFLLCPVNLIFIPSHYQGRRSAASYIHLVPSPPGPAEETVCVLAE